MSDFIVAVGLVLVIEGLIYAAFPQAAKRMAANAAAAADGALRIAGVVAAIVGVLLVWLMRGE